MSIEVEGEVPAEAPGEQRPGLTGVPGDMFPDSPNPYMFEEVSNLAM